MQTTAMMNYYALNQLLCGKSFKQLDNPLQSFLRREQLEEAYSSAATQLPEERDNVVRTFLNYLRVPDYTFDITEEGKPLLISQVAEIAREKNVPIQGCSHWAVYLISGFNENVRPLPEVSDGFLAPDAKILEEEPDLMLAMERAFCAYVWGTMKEPNSKYKDWFKQLLDTVMVSEDISLSTSKMESLLEGFAKHRVNPLDVGRSAVVVSDLSEMMRTYKCLARWADVNRGAVSIVIPRNSSQSTLASGVLSIEDFKALVTNEPETLQNMCAKGDRISFGKVRV